MANRVLKGTIIRCVTAAYSRNDVQDLINESYHLAHSYLKMKSANNKNYIIRDEKADDLAWDFIADLFQKDQEGNLLVLQRYFESIDIQNLDEEDLRVELRKLVFTKVDDNIFRFYGEKDPSLRKIIRNIKLTIKDHKCKHKVCYQDGYLITDLEDHGVEAIMPEDFMRIKLCSRLSEQMQIPEIIIEVIDIIQKQNSYRNRFPLIALAKIIRESFVILHDEKDHSVVRPMAVNQLVEKDISKFIHHSVKKVKRDVAPGYIKRGKIKPEYVEIYFNAAADIVKDDFGEERGLSQFDQIKNYKQDLDYDQFRKKHRSVLEYVVKLIRVDLIRSMKKEWVRF